MKGSFVEAKKEIENIIKDLNSTTLCFTGHRSQKLPWLFNETDERCLEMKKVLRVEIESSILSGYKTFISGMAIGFDMICAEIVLELKKKYTDIKIIGALPCKNQDCKWREKEKNRYRKLISQLDETRCIYDEYNGAECMHERNCYMINKSSKVIALFDGKSGGTKKTLEYAKVQGLKIVVIKP